MAARDKKGEDEGAGPGRRTKPAAKAPKPKAELPKLPGAPRPRGRPPARPRPQPAAKTRGRKRAEPPDPGAPAPRDPEPTKPAALRRIVKRKQLVSVLAKKKGILSKRTLKTEIKKVNPKPVKKIPKPTAIVKTEPGTESEADEPGRDEPARVETPLVEIKREPETPDSPLTSFESRSSSPRTGSARKQRTSSDLFIVKSQETDGAASSPKSANRESQRSTRSERSNSPFPTSDETQKLLRNGKRRVKTTLLNEVVEQESKKRRLISESRDPKGGEADPVDVAKKIKRLRSFSKDGGDLSNASETDVGFSESLIDVEIKKKTAEENPEREVASENLEAVEKVSERIDDVSEVPSVEVEIVATKISTDVVADGENDNSAKADLEDVADGPEGAVEKIAEKSLILDNMSKTFNDAALPAKTNIRRSARQRKSTVKAKEQEETILAEISDPTSEVAIKTPKKIPTENPDGAIVERKREIVEDESSNGEAILADPTAIKPKTFCDDVPTKNADAPASDPVVAEADEREFEESNLPLKFTVAQPCSKPDDGPSDDPGKMSEDCGDLNDEEDDKIDDSSKENIQNPYAGKSFTHHDIDKLIDKLKNFEEQDRKRQEMSKLNQEKRPVMVSNDVVLIPKPNLDPENAKEPPAAVTIAKTEEKENVRNGADLSPTSIVKRERRKSFEIDLPSGVTLIKRTGAASRKHSTGSNSKDGDTVTMIDKSLGKEVTLDIRKSLDSARPSSALLKNNIQLLPNSSKMQKSNTAKESTVVVPKVPPAKIADEKASDAKTARDILPGSESNPSTSSSKKSEIELRSLKLFNLLPDETPEQQKEKVEVLKTLGLLTLEAANQAKLDKQKQKELIKSNKNPIPKYASNEGYTGTLKTVIKLNRPNSDKKKGRSPLKMTFQKSKGRGGKFADPLSGESESDENPCYTLLHKESGGSSGSGTGSSDNHLTSGGHRKTHYSNRFNNHEMGTQDRLADSAVELNASSKETTTNLVIPEKASSFGIHPERLCQDQCFYCGGKFGLFDTPCHIAQIKSVERQKKILDNEEKLTVDSCLCDACYRHVDRRANCPSYRKRTVPVASMSSMNSNIGDTCYANSCCKPAPHTLRRKWLVKIRRSISKVIQLDLDYPGLHTIPLCDLHYQAVSQLMVCGLCKRRLSRNHVHYINQEYQTLNPLLEEQGIPVVLDEKPVVCKLCRYFCTLLQRPYLMQQVNKKAFLKGYRRRLMLTHNIEVPDESDTDNTDEHSIPTEINVEQNESTKEKKRGKAGKSKVKKSVDNHKPDENCIDKGNGPWKKSNNHMQGNNSTQNSKMEIEDVESLISSNKIPVLSKVTNLMDSADPMVDYDNPLIAALDKQSELQNLLQKCNVPSSTILQRIGISDSNQKSKNILKVHNAPAINKKKMNRNLRRIQKLGQIITQKDDFEETLNCKIPNREDFTIEPMNIGNIDITSNIRDNGSGLLRNIVLNDECTIETLPSKTSKGGLDINSMKNKWQMTESFSQVKKNLSVLSKNLNSDHVRKRTQGQTELSNPVRRLETNPSISVRELFPGEEEMNLQCAIEFGNIKGVTPEGWEKCNSTIQYDKYTKSLWNELQKPYGNQSSFLRHLILLEKYFRNGDLILSSNANCNAATYSESVQNRLRSYDNIPTNGDVSYNYNLSSLSKTHTVTMPGLLEPGEILKKSDGTVEFRKPTMNISAGKSLLKSNQNVNSDSAKTNRSPYPTVKKIGATLVNYQVEQNSATPKLLKSMPVSLTHLEKLGNQLTPLPVPRPSTPRPDAVKSTDNVKNADIRTSTPKSDSITTKSRIPSLPPELIAINPQRATQKKSIESVLKNIELTKGSASQPAVSKSFSAISPVATAITQQKLSKSVNTSKESKKGAKGATKQWRPTLIPITNESKSRTTRDILHQTADGRRLPSLVQVMSGGKPYHITIEDYNKMCIMRREKLKLEQKAELLKQSATTNQTEVPMDSTANTTITPVAAVTKPTSPAPTEADKPAVVQQSTKGKEETVTPAATKTAIVAKGDDSETGKSILPELDATLLKNVVLKNITIAPITSAPDAKTSGSQSLLITSAKSVSVVPPAKSLPNTTATVKLETNSETGTVVTPPIPKVIPITSQAVIMPKIPKSLTVIPQSLVLSTVSVCPTPAPSVSPTLGPLSVLPISTTITLTTPTVTASPSEP